MFGKHECTKCGFIYDDMEKLDGGEDIFDDLSILWVCPGCGSVREEFQMVIE